MDRDKALGQARWIDPSLEAIMEAAPCHAEFYRYVQWHNLAFSMARDMGILSFVLHYEDYRDNFKNTLEGLLNFLEVPRIKDGPEFELGKQYTDYYSVMERLAVANMMKEAASRETWHNLKHYFDGIDEFEVSDGGL